MRLILTIFFSFLLVAFSANAQHYTYRKPYSSSRSIDNRQSQRSNSSRRTDKNQQSTRKESSPQRSVIIQRQTYRNNSYNNRRSFDILPRRNNASSRTNRSLQSTQNDRMLQNSESINSNGPLYSTENYYSKRMIKAFVAAKEQKLEKVEGYWQDMEDKYNKEKDSYQESDLKTLLFPIWQLSECMVMNSSQGREKGKVNMPYNPWDAYSQLKAVTEKPEDRWNADAFLSHKDIGLSIASIKSLIEANLVKITKKAGTETQYDQLIYTLYDYANIAQIEKEREQAAFSAISQTTEVTECQRYLEKYPEISPSHLLMIENRRDSLAFDQLDTTANACINYLSNYPNSRFNNKVTQRLHKYEFTELEHTERACQQYLSKYPQSEYSEQVKSLMEKYAFEEAQETGTYTAYRDFLNKYKRSPYTDKALTLMERALYSQFFNKYVKLDDLNKYFITQNGYSRIDDSKIRILYTNLLCMPTSALLRESDGLIGQVEISTTISGSENTEELLFTQQGLLKTHINSRNGRRDEYQYTFDAIHGFQLMSKTDNKGNTVRYTMKYDDQGLVSEITASDGDKIVYSFDDGRIDKVSYINGGKVIKTDYYSSHYRIVKSVREGVTILYKYNDEGDVVSLSKQKNGVVLETTTYEYEYNTDKLWTRMIQYNNGNYFLTKYRQFNQSTNRLQSTYSKI